MGGSHRIVALSRAALHYLVSFIRELTIHTYIVHTSIWYTCIRGEWQCDRTASRADRDKAILMRCRRARNSRHSRRRGTAIWHTIVVVVLCFVLCFASPPLPLKSQRYCSKPGMPTLVCRYVSTVCIYVYTVYT
ncbi:hypothetical protein F5Y01DRAFT_102811 [Xylaria sp. FL0043]|nr:hypothetical protein F5Y01DRAFT_102811 [Xylaria sp. FL0043]